MDSDSGNETRHWSADGIESTSISARAPCDGNGCVIVMTANKDDVNMAQGANISPHAPLKIRGRNDEPEHVDDGENDPCGGDCGETRLF